MRILVIGDIVGKPGRVTIEKYLPTLKESRRIDFVIANAENSAGGVGVTTSTATELLSNGVDVLTSGNHIWAQKDIIPTLDSDMPIIRPLNYPPGLPGRGYVIKGGVMVVNIIGRTFMDNYDCPFRAMDALLKEVKNKPPVIIVDFHAEATSEKIAMGRHLDGRVSAVLGTHTHVGTIDTRVLSGGTAYVTDIGMVGPVESVIGVEFDAVLQRFMTMIHNKLTVAQGRCMLNAVIVNVDEKTGKASGIERVNIEEDR